MRPFHLPALKILGIGLLVGVPFVSAPLFAEGASDHATWSPMDPRDRTLATAWGQETALLRGVHLLTFEGTSAKPGFTSSLLAGRDGNKIPVQAVQVLTGRVDALLVPSADERGVLLAAPDQISAIATNGRVSMAVTGHEVLVSVLRGSAKVGYRGIFKDLRPGVVRVFDRKTGRARDVALSPAPNLESKGTLGVAMTGGATVSVGVPEGATHCVALRDDRESTLGPSKCVPGGSHVSFQVPTAGNYFAYARALGDGGLDGALSEPVRLQVLGLAPEQAPPENGVFLLAPFERVHFRGVEGLEMRIGSSDDFVAATPSVGLRQNLPTSVEFRNPNSPQQRTVVRLAPRISGIKTVIGPANATWPGTPATVTVAIRDGAGRLLTEGDNLKLRLAVNTTPIDATFEMTDEGLVATVPPQAGKGPWVVRLTVLDEKDRMIARDILEVAAR